MRREDLASVAPQRNAADRGRDGETSADSPPSSSSDRAESCVGLREGDASPLGGRWFHFAPAAGFGDAGGGGGLDHVDFLLAAGPSEPLRPLSAVASGGESARVMLALKAAASFAEPRGGAGAAASSSDAAASGAPVLILDELDSSIGAR